MILAIGSQNDFLHVYQNENDLVAAKVIGPGERQFTGPVEFFDSEGNQFTGVNDGQGNLMALNPTADPLDLPALLQRLRNPFDRVRSYIEDNSEDFDLQVRDAAARLLQASTSAELNGFLRFFVADSPNENVIGFEQNPGNQGHNAFHSVGIGHP